MSNTLRSKLNSFDAGLSLAHARTIPSLWYHDAEIFDAERQQIFHRTWQALGRVDQVAQPGSFFTAELTGEPVVLVRDEAGVLRAFSNVCRHRAACVMNEAQGRATKLRCRYHGWTYDLAGRLRGTPEFEGVANFRREDHGLAPLTVAEWGPLVWVHLGGSPPTLHDFLAPLDEQTQGLSLERMHFVQRREYRLACNWKVFVDNYLDGGYHVNTVHPGLAGVIDYAHYRTEIDGNTSVQISPLRAGDEDAAAVGKVRAGNNAYYWWIFPNLMLNIYQGVMDTNLVLPLGTDACRVVFDFYFEDPDSPGRRTFIEESIAVAHQIQIEDQDICEEVQRGVHSRFFDTGRFSVRREAAGYHFHRLLAGYLGAGVDT